MKANQKGFSVIEVLIVVVIVGLLGAVGWLVYDRQKNQTDNKDTAAPTSEQANKQVNSPEGEDEAKQPSYFEVKELGVKFELYELSDDLSGLYYSMGNNNRTAYFSLNELGGTDCAADKTAQVALTRYTDEDFADDPMVPKEAARKIGSYYYLVSGGQAACSEDDRIQKRASQLRFDIMNLLPRALVSL